MEQTQTRPQLHHGIDAAHTQNGLEIERTVHAAPVGVDTPEKRWLWFSFFHRKVIKMQKMNQKLFWVPIKTLAHSLRVSLSPTSTCTMTPPFPTLEIDVLC